MSEKLKFKNDETPNELSNAEIIDETISENTTDLFVNLLFEPETISDETAVTSDGGGRVLHIETTEKGIAKDEIGDLFALKLQEPESKLQFEKNVDLKEKQTKKPIKKRSHKFETKKEKSSHSYDNANQRKNGTPSVNVNAATHSPNVSAIKAPILTKAEIKQDNRIYRLQHKTEKYGGKRQKSEKKVYSQEKSYKACF